MTSSGLVDAAPPLRRVRYSSSAPLHEVGMRRRVGASGAPPDAPPSPPRRPHPPRGRGCSRSSSGRLSSPRSRARSRRSPRTTRGPSPARSRALSRASRPPASSPRLVTPEELATRDGSDDSDPRVWLAILGVVYDVTAGATHYAPGGAYAGLAARDASAAFHTGDFTPDGLHPSLDALEPDDFEAAVATLDEWSKFYEDRYERVGVLAPGGIATRAGRRRRRPFASRRRARRAARARRTRRRRRARPPSRRAARGGRRPRAGRCGARTGGVTLGRKCASSGGSGG